MLENVKEQTRQAREGVRSGMNTAKILMLLSQAQQSLDNIELILKIDGNDVSIVEDTKSILDKISELI